MDREGAIPSYPFEYFIDVCSFLDRMFHNRSGGLKDIESRHKLSLSGDDSTNLERFTRELPRVFGSSVTLNPSTIKGDSRSALPSLPTFKT